MHRQSLWQTMVRTLGCDLGPNVSNAQADPDAELMVEGWCSSSKLAPLLTKWLG